VQEAWVARERVVAHDEAVRELLLRGNLALDFANVHAGNHADHPEEPVSRVVGLVTLLCVRLRTSCPRARRA